MQPVVKLIPFENVDVAPPPCAIAPFLSIEKSVVVEFDVELATMNAYCEVSLLLSDTASLPHGLDVPIPNPLPVHRVISTPPTIALILPATPAAKPVVA